MKAENTKQAQELDDDPWWASVDSQARVIATNREIRDNDIRPLLSLREMLVGPHFGGGVGDISMDKPKNTTYGFYSHIYSQVLGGDLECIIDADFGSPEEAIGLRQEHGINRTFDRAGGREVVELVLADMVCGYGALMVTPPEESTTTLREHERSLLRHPLGAVSWDEDGAAPRLENNEAGELLAEAQPQTDASPREPGIMYLAPGQWSYDRRASTVAKAEFTEYQTVHDINVLIAEAKEEGEGPGKWYVEKLRDARTQMNSAADALGGRPARKGHFSADAERDQVVLTTLIVKGATIKGQEPPKNHNAVSYTLHSSSESVESSNWVREPYYVFVPPWGSFVHFYQHMTGEDSLAMSVLTANKTAIEATDAIHGVAMKRIREYKSNPVFDLADTEEIERLESALDGVPVGLQGGPSGLKYENVIRGGLDAVIVNAIQYFDGILGEDLGMDSAARGAASGGDTTATETTYAAGQSHKRVLQFQSAFNRGMAQLYRTIGWYIGHDSRYVVRADFRSRAAFHEEQARGQVGDVDAAEVGRRSAGDRESQGLIQGGDFSESEEFDFNELRFSINAQRQVAVTPEQRRAESAQLRMELIQLMQVVAQLPLYDWVTEVRQLEKDYGRRGLVEAFNAENASLIAQVQVEGGQPPADVASAPGAQRDQSNPRVTMQNARPMAQQESLRRGADSGQAAGGQMAGMQGAPQLQ